MGDGHRLRTETLPQALGCLQHPVHGVAYNQRAPTVPQFATEPVREYGQIVVEPFHRHLGTAARRSRGACGQHGTAGGHGGDQRVGVIGEMQRLRQLRCLLPGVRGGQLPPSAGRQGRGEHHHRYAVGGKPFQYAIEVGVHIRVVGVDFVDHDDFARDGQMPQSQVTALEPGEEHLVDGAHREGGEQRLLPAPEPLMRVQSRRASRVGLSGRGQPLVTVQFDGGDGPGSGLRHPGPDLVERGLGMREDHRAGAVRGKTFQPAEQPGKHGVAGGPGRQGDQTAPGAGTGRQDLRRRERRLRLPLAHRRFDDQHAGGGHGTGHPYGFFLYGPDRGAVRQVEAVPEQVGRVLLRLLGPPRSRQVQPGPGGAETPVLSLFHLPRSLGARRRPGRGVVREQIGGTGDPVGHDHDRGQRHLDGLGQTDGLPLLEPSLHPGPPRARVQQLVLHRAPDGLARPARTQQPGAGPEIVDLLVIGRRAVMPAGHDGELPGRPAAPSVALGQPLLYEELPGQPVRSHATV